MSATPASAAKHVPSAHVPYVAAVALLDKRTTSAPDLQIPRPTLKSQRYKAATASTMSLQPPQDSPSRPLSIRTTGTSATMADKTGEAWRGDVGKHNCWEDLILTLGTYVQNLLSSNGHCTFKGYNSEKVIRKSYQPIL